MSNRRSLLVSNQLFFSGDMSGGGGHTADYDYVYPFLVDNGVDVLDSEARLDLGDDCHMLDGEAEYHHQESSLQSETDGNPKVEYLSLAWNSTSAGVKRETCAGNRRR
jgi:hypothetical protein